MIKEHFSGRIQDILAADKWLIIQEVYQPEDHLKYETIFGLSNGYMGIRGFHDEGNNPSLPYSFINGVFDKAEAFMKELVVLPNAMGLKLYTDMIELSPETCTIMEYFRVLDMKNSLLVRRIILEDEKGRQTLIESLRYLSRKNTHRAEQILYVTPLNYDGILEVESLIDSSIYNFYDAPRFKVKHSTLSRNESLIDDGIYMEIETKDERMPVGVGSLLNLYNEAGKSIEKNRKFSSMGEKAIEFKDADIKEGEILEIQKHTVYYAGRDLKEGEVKGSVLSDLNTIDSHSQVYAELKEHQSCYRAMWNQADLEITGDDDLDKSVRYNIYQLMSSANEFDEHLNIGAKLLHGEEYGGHAFWDSELFMLPFFSHVFPDTAQKLVKYRHNLLDQARKNSEMDGYKGAKYPWESADKGDEQCPDWTIEYDGSCVPCYVAKYEHHVTADVAYGIHNYGKITGDQEFVLHQGMEIIMETARFWVSRFQYNKDLDRYEIHQVTGPDEWHEPVDNNCFTNYMAKWNIETAVKNAGEMKSKHPLEYKSLMNKISATEQELESWSAVAEKVYLPSAKDGQLFEQFEGYFNLEDITIEEYDDNDMPVRPAKFLAMDREKTQIIKQADVVMLMYLLGNEFDSETRRINYDYYEKRTLHGSSLSPSIYAIMGLNTGNSSMAYRYLKRASLIDLADSQKNAREGIHAANAGGVWKTVVFGFAGVSFDAEGYMNIDPRMPENWEKLKFKIWYRGSHSEITIDKNGQVEIKLLEGSSFTCKINSREESVK